LICIIGQIATITHEFGHAVPALLFTYDKVRITFGNVGMKTKRMKFNRLCLEIGTFQPFSGFVNWNGDKLKKWQRIVVSSGGPIISLVIGVILIVTSRNIDNYILKKLISFSGYYHIWQFICTAIPIIYPSWWYGYGGCSSDGYNIINIMKDK
jgi:hypothetical protein